MKHDRWTQGFETSDGRYITVRVIADGYVDAGTVKYRDHTVEIHLTQPRTDYEVDQRAVLKGEPSFDGLSASDARTLARWLNQAAAHIEQSDGG